MGAKTKTMDADTAALQKQLFSKRKRRSDDHDGEQDDDGIGRFQRQSDYDSDSDDNADRPKTGAVSICVPELRLDPDDPDSFGLIDDGSGVKTEGRKAKKRRGNNSESDVNRKKNQERRRKAKRPDDISDDDIDVNSGVNVKLAALGPDMLANWLGRRVDRFGSTVEKKRPGGNGGRHGGLTELELMDLRIDSSLIVPTDDSSWQSRPRITDSLPDFLHSFIPGGLSQLRTGVTTPGCPHTLVLAMSGLRSVDLFRTVKLAISTADSRSQPGSNTASPGLVAKLFAKHIKMNEAIEMCSKTRMSIGVGTPQRILDLLDAQAVPDQPTRKSNRNKNGRNRDEPEDEIDYYDLDDESTQAAARPALSIENLKTVVIDASHIDVKKRGILDTPESVLPLVKLLVRLANRLKDAHLHHLSF